MKHTRNYVGTRRVGVGTALDPQSWRSVRRFNRRQYKRNVFINTSRVPKELHEWLGQGGDVKELLKLTVKRLSTVDPTFLCWIRQEFDFRPSAVSKTRIGAKDTAQQQHTMDKDTVKTREGRDSRGTDGAASTAAAFSMGISTPKRNKRQPGDVRGLSVLKDPYKKASGKVRSKAVPAQARGEVEEQGLSKGRTHIMDKVKGDKGRKSSNKHKRVKGMSGSKMSETETETEGKSDVCRVHNKDTIVTTPMKQGGKRGAKETPPPSPDKASIQDDPTFAALKLDDKLKRVDHRAPTTAEAKSIIADPNWGGEKWDEEEVYRQLISDEVTVGSEVEGLGYFDWQFGKGKRDETTKWLISRLNYFKVVDALKVKAKQFFKGDPTSSSAHPTKGPFYLRADTKGEVVTIKNSMNSQVMKFKMEEMEMNTGDIEFDTLDMITYLTLSWKGRAILDLMKDLRDHACNEKYQRFGDPTNGPYRIVISGDKSSRYLEMNSGDRFSIEPALDGTWKKVRVQYCYSTKVMQGQGRSQRPGVKVVMSTGEEEVDVKSCNSYEALSEDEDDEEEGSKSNNMSVDSSEDSVVTGTGSSNETDSNSSNSSHSSESNTSLSSSDSSKGDQDVISVSSSSINRSSYGDSGSAKSFRQQDNTSEQTDSAGDSAEGHTRRQRRRRRRKRSTASKEVSNEEGKVEGVQDSLGELDSTNASGPTVPDKEETFKVSAAETSDVDSDGDASEMEEVFKLNQTTINDITPTTPSADSTASTLSTASMGSTILNPDNGVFLAQLNAEFAPNKEHVERAIEAIKFFHSAIQLEDPSAMILPRPVHTLKMLPPLKSPEDKNYPTGDWMSLSKYCDIPNKYVLAQDPIDKKTLEARLRRSKIQRESKSDKESKKKKSKSGSTAKGPTSVVVILKVKTQVSPQLWDRLIESTDLMLSRKQKIKVSMKSVQCWDSGMNKALIGVNNELDPAGVAQALLHYCKELEKSLLKAGTITTEVAAQDLPYVHVTVRKLRELSVPDDEKNKLTFSTFVDQCQLVFMIETSVEGWIRLDPLFDLLMRSKRLQRIFGPKAHFLDLAPNRRLSISAARKYQAKGRIGMAYQAATTTIDCAAVHSFDVEVKVKMQDDKMERPWKLTTLRREMTRVQFDGNRVFHTGICTLTPPEHGQSRLVVPYDPSNANCKELLKFAKMIASNMAAWWWNWWKYECGYHDSTIKRLMNSFYFNFSACASDSVWCKETKHVTTKHLASVDAYLEENAEMDPLHEDYKGATFSFDKDEKRRSILEKVNYKPDRDCDDVQSKYSAMTGDDESSGASSLRDETSLGLAMGRTASLKMELARAKAALADKEYEFRKMKEQLDSLGPGLDTEQCNARVGGTWQKVGFQEDQRFRNICKS